MNRTVYYVNAGPEPVGIYTGVFALRPFDLAAGSFVPLLFMKNFRNFSKRRSTAEIRGWAVPRTSAVHLHNEDCHRPACFSERICPTLPEFAAPWACPGALPAENRARLPNVRYILAQRAANVNILGKISYKIVTWPQVPEMLRAPRGLGFGSFFLAEKF